jgi:hypothetical protein
MSCGTLFHVLCKDKYHTKRAMLILGHGISSLVEINILRDGEKIG